MKTNSLTSRAVAVAAALFIVVCAGSIAAFDIPGYTGPITDQAGVLSSSDREELSRKIIDYKNGSGNQIGVLIVSTLDGGAIDNIAHDVFMKWGIGKSGKDNGVLFLVAIEDRKARVEVGYGLEGELTDIECGRLVSRKSPMAERFRRQDYAGGVREVVTGIITAIGGEYKPKGSDDDDKARTGFPFILAIIIFMIVMSAIARRRRSYLRGGRNDWWMGGMGGLGGLGGFGGGHGGGGGGFSFGGGSSGGGGASGGW